MAAMNLIGSYNYALVTLSVLIAIFASYAALACHNAGPLDEKTRRLVKLAIAVGAGTEGGTHSAVRHAAEAGVTAEEMEHVVLLSITTIGFPAAGRALSWIHDKTQ